MKRSPTPHEEAGQLEADYPWMNAIDHDYCKKCRPHALQLASMLGKAIRVTRLLRGMKL